MEFGFSAISRFPSLLLRAARLFQRGTSTWCCATEFNHGHYFFHSLYAGSPRTEGRDGLPAEASGLK